jgi:hypothetical protein
MTQHPSAEYNSAIRNAPNRKARERIRARLNRFPKVTNLGVGPIVRLQDRYAGLVMVELPPTLSKVHGSLVTHPNLVKVDPAFCDDTLDGETFFCSAHNAEWSSGKRFHPFRITHIASGLRIGRDFETRAEADAVAAKLTSAASGVDWSMIDAGHENAEARPHLIRVREILDSLGAR